MPKDCFQMKFKKNNKQWKQLILDIVFQAKAWFYHKKHEIIIVKWMFVWSGETKDRTLTTTTPIKIQTHLAIKVDRKKWRLKLFPDEIKLNERGIKANTPFFKRICSGMGRENWCWSSWFPKTWRQFPCYTILSYTKATRWHKR